MFWINYTFYDKYWNFDNTKFVKLLEKTKKDKQNKVHKKIGNLNINISLFDRVSRKELWEFLNKLSIFINSWIDIKWALNILSKQIKNTYLKKIWIEMKTNIDHGIKISETMQQYPKVFDPLIVALIWVWEVTWKLWAILSELEKNLLENIELKWKIKWAMIYPIILVLFTLLMVIFMMIFIVPRITESFQKADTALPALTQFVINVSDLFVNDWLKLLIIVLSIFAFFKFLNTTYFWRTLFAHIYLKLPVFWYMIKQSNIVYFIKSFTTLLDSGVLLLESIKTSSKVVPNLAYKKEIIRIKNEVEIWLTISKSLWLNINYDSSVYINKLFPEDFAYIVNVWEETWTLSLSMQKIWRNYGLELKRYVWNLSSMMEPFIIVLVWFLVWTIVIAIMLPFFEMWKIAKNL
jgi:type IV pilus assembly protein PilC